MSWTSWKFWTVASVIVGFISFLGFGLTMDPKKVPSPLIGRVAPDFELTSFNGGDSVRLSELRGQPVVINFWASWCVECRVEAGVLESFYQEFDRKKGEVRLLGVAIQDTPEKAKAFAQHFGKTYFLGIDQANGQIALDYGIYGVPETFFIDAEGVIQFKQIGGVTPELMVKQLDALRSPSTPKS